MPEENKIITLDNLSRFKEKEDALLAGKIDGQGQIIFCTQAEFDAASAQGELVVGAYYVITDDDTDQVLNGKADATTVNAALALKADKPADTDDVWTPASYFNYNLVDFFTSMDSEGYGQYAYLISQTHAPYVFHDTDGNLYVLEQDPDYPLPIHGEGALLAYAYLNKNAGNVLNHNLSNHPQATKLRITFTPDPETGDVIMVATILSESRYALASELAAKADKPADVLSTWVVPSDWENLTDILEAQPMTASQWYQFLPRPDDPEPETITYKNFHDVEGNYYSFILFDDEYNNAYDIYFYPADAHPTIHALSPHELVNGIHCALSFESDPETGEKRIVFGEEQHVDLINTVLNKQDQLISGVNIRTINGNSLLGDDDLTISGGVTEARVQEMIDAAIGDALAASY